jgi:hypothetical protein
VECSLTNVWSVGPLLRSGAVPIVPATTEVVLNGGIECAC